MVKQLDELWAYAQGIAKEELKDTAPLDFKTIDADKVKETVQAIEEVIKDKEVSKKVKQKLAYAKKNFAVKLDEYKVKEEILDGRNSYSKTDNDATFMRMKEDPMKNGQLKPGYNVQITTNNQIITNYDTFANPTDTLTLPAHIESFKQLYGEAPKTVTADSGYGSEQNYECLEENNCTAYVKYNHFHQEQQGKRLKKYPFAVEYLHYNQEQDYYVCPMGQHMNNIGTCTRKNDSGFEQTISRYRAKNCQGCPLRGFMSQSQRQPHHRSKPQPEQTQTASTGEVNQ